MAETADIATNPKTIPPAVFQKRAGGNISKDKSSDILQNLFRVYSVYRL